MARQLFRLMAYKGRVRGGLAHADPAFAERIGAMFRRRLPADLPSRAALLARRNDRLRRSARWRLDAATVFRLLAGLPCGAVRSILSAAPPERREERALIDQYRATIEELLPR